MKVYFYNSATLLFKQSAKGHWLGGFQRHTSHHNFNSCKIVDCQLVVQKMTHFELEATLSYASSKHQASNVYTPTKLTPHRFEPNDV